MTELIRPHDKFFKETFTRLDIARDFLSNYLPTAVVALLDLDSLTIEPDSFVDPDLQEQFADLLYKVNLYSGGETYIYTLMEHKSVSEKHTPLQLLRYMTAIWESDRRKKEPLRPIIPIVLYHGRAPWNAPLNFSGLFTGDEVLRPYWPDFSYELQDLSTLPESEITGEPQLRIGLLTLKYISASTLNGRLVGILTLFSGIPETATALEYLRTVLYYMNQAGKYVESEDIVTAVQAVLDDGGNELMENVADHWIEQGMERGMKRGMERGMERGMKDKRNIARKLLKLHGVVTVSELTGLSIEEVVELQEEQK